MDYSICTRFAREVGMFILLFILVQAQTEGAAGSAGNLSLEVKREASAWTILNGGKKVMTYAFDPQKFKPFIKELCTIRGDNILRDAPHDHLHHHALMYGIKVNGINFWEEISGSGVQKVVESPEPTLSAGPSGKASRASITQVIHWVAPQDAFLPNDPPVALLIEKRTLVLTLDEAAEEVAVEWQSDFQVGPKTDKVTLTGSNYHGLGMRFLQELDPLAVHSIGGIRPELSNSRQDVSGAPWAAVSFNVPGRPATVVLAGHPWNARGNATYFSMLTPFAYISATQAIDKEPLVYKQGQKFQLRFLVLTYPEAKTSEKMQKRIEQWRRS